MTGAGGGGAQLTGGGQAPGGSTGEGVIADDGAKVLAREGVGAAAADCCGCHTATGKVACCGGGAANEARAAT